VVLLVGRERIDAVCRRGLRGENSGSSEKAHVGERKELRDLQTRKKGNEVTREVGQEQTMQARTKKKARSPRGSTGP
jgi:hypothetical protein